MFVVDRNLLYAGPLFQMECFVKGSFAAKLKRENKVERDENWFVAPRLPRGPFLCYISHLLGWPFGGATLVIWSSVTNMATTLYSELWVLNTNVFFFFGNFLNVTYFRAPSSVPDFPSRQQSCLQRSNLSMSKKFNSFIQASLAGLEWKWNICRWCHKKCQISICHINCSTETNLDSRCFECQVGSGLMKYFQLKLVYLRNCLRSCGGDPDDGFRGP